MGLLRDMALFVEVAKTRSLKRAAETLGIPDSTLSRRLSALEHDVGLRLLSRTTRRIELTEAGLVYFTACKQIMEAAESANEQVRNMAEKPRGRLRLALPVDFSTFFLAPLIAEFAALYPAITFDLRLSEGWADLSSEGFDLAIRLGVQPDSTLTVRQLSSIYYSLYAAPAYLKMRGEPQHPSELAGHSCIRMVCPHWDDKWTLLNGAESLQIKVEERLAANNVALVRRFATLGFGIAPLDNLLAREDLKAGRLQRVCEGWSFRPVPILALTSSKMLPAKTRLFVDFLADRLSRLLQDAHSTKPAPETNATNVVA